MRKVTFTTEQKEHIVYKIKAHFKQELGDEIGQFDAEFLLEFFADEVGPYFYNKGLQDATHVIESQSDTMKDTLYTMKEPTF